MDSQILVAASYDLQITASEIPLVDGYNPPPPQKFNLTGSQANRIIPISTTKFAVATNPMILIYDRTSKNQKPFTFQGHQTNVLDLCLNSDGSRLYSCSEDKSWRVWDFSRNRAIAFYTTNSSINTLALLSNNLIILGNDAGIVNICQLSDGSVISSTPLFDFPVRSIAVIRSSDSSDLNQHDTAFIGGRDGLLIVADINVKDGKLTVRSRIQAHNKVLTRVTISPNNQYFATTSEDSTCKVWSVETLQPVCEPLSGDSSKWMWDAVFMADNKKIITAGSDKICRVWDFMSGKIVKTVELHQKGITCIAVL